MTIFGFLFLGLCLAAGSTLFLVGLEFSQGYVTWFNRVVAAASMTTAFVCVWIAIWKGLA